MTEQKRSSVVILGDSFMRNGTHYRNLFDADGRPTDCAIDGRPVDADTYAKAQQNVMLAAERMRAAGKVVAIEWPPIFAGNGGVTGKSAAEWLAQNPHKAPAQDGKK
jgi:hypothetical protein